MRPHSGSDHEGKGQMRKIFGRQNFGVWQWIVDHGQGGRTGDGEWTLAQS